MSVKQIDPKQTYATLQDDRNSVYIDVRTADEFAAGHVPGAVNIPVMMPDPASRRMAANPQFLDLVQSNFPKEKKIICGCQMGGRSQHAADLLVQAGFTDVSNMQGGFGGAKDPMGRVVAPGWLQSDLPVEK
jgi:rhodanese-related sulfurtransferase